MGGGRREVLEKEKRGAGEAEEEERPRGGLEEKKRGRREEADVENRVGRGVGVEAEEVEVVRAVKGEGTLGRGVEGKRGEDSVRLEGKRGEMKVEDSEERVALPLEPTVRIETR